MDDRIKIMSQKIKQDWVLGGVLCVALGLRLWGIGFDLPYMTHSHEYHEVHRALRLGMGEFDFTRVTKGGYFYILFVEYSILFLVLFLTGTITSVKDFSFFYLKDPSPFWLIGRITTAFIGTATVFVLYLIVKRLLGKRQALIGAIPLAVYPLHVELSHYISVDVPMVFFLTLTLYYCINMQEFQRYRDYILSGLFFAFAVMTKFPAIPFILSLGVAHIMAVGSREWIPKKLVNKKFILGGGVFLAVYIIGNPGIILSIGSVIRHFSPLPINSNSQATQTALFSEYRPNLFFFYSGVLSSSMGFGLLGSSLIGIIFSMNMDRRAGIIIGLFVVAYFLSICLSGTPLFYPRYVLPLIPFLLIGFSYFCHGLEESKLFVKQPPRWLFLILFGMILLPLLNKSIEGNVTFNQIHTRIIAKDWVEKNIPSGSKILTEGNPSSASPNIIPIRNLPVNLIAVADKISVEKPGKAEYLRRLSEVQKGIAFDLVMVWSRFEEWETLEYYQDLGIEYIILNPNKHDRNLDAKRKHGVALRESRFSLYDQIKENENVKIVISFDPEKRNAKGHPIEIYRVKKR